MAVLVFRCFDVVSSFLQSLLLSKAFHSILLQP